jgi:hypothetical protein
LRSKIIKYRDEDIHIAGGIRYIAESAFSFEGKKPDLETVNQLLEFTFTRGRKSECKILLCDGNLWDELYGLNLLYSEKKETFGEKLDYVRCKYGRLAVLSVDVPDFSEEALIIDYKDIEKWQTDSEMELPNQDFIYVLKVGFTLKNPKEHIRVRLK